MKCGDYDLRIGTQVLIYSTDGKMLIGKARYIGHKKMWLFDSQHQDKMPKFKLEPGNKLGRRRFIYGYECWWIPVSVAKKAEKEIANAKRR
jgi:hypothetical protein